MTTDAVEKVAALHREGCERRRAAALNSGKKANTSWGSEVAGSPKNAK